MTFTDVDLSDHPDQLDHRHVGDGDAGEPLCADDGAAGCAGGRVHDRCGDVHLDDGTGTIGWHYDIADSALDFLGAHDQVTLTYTVQVDDGNGRTPPAGRYHHGARHRGQADDHDVGTQAATITEDNGGSGERRRTAPSTRRAR